MEQKRMLSFPLRLSPSVRQQATELARMEGISLNHFISLAVAEKISRMEHEAWLRQQGKAPAQGVLARPQYLRRP
jgi:hypothetical protein